MNNITYQEIAQNFSQMMVKQYMEHIEYWYATAMDDVDEMKIWEKKIKNETQVVQKKVYHKLLSIMKDRKKYMRFYKRIGVLRRERDIIRITCASGFFNDILNGEGISHAFPINAEYLINRQDGNITCNVYSSRIKK